MPRPDELKAENVRTQYLPEILDNITLTLDSVYSSYEKSYVSRLDYILIDGKPIRALMCERSGMEIVTSEEALYLVPSMILNALVNGQRVSACVPERGTGAFKIENLVQVNPLDMEPYFENEEVLQEFKNALAENPYPTKTGEDLSPQEINGLEYTNGLLLEKISKYSLGSIVNISGYYIKEGYMRDIVNDPELNPLELTGQQLLVELNGMETMRLTLDRQAFGSHVIGMLILEGHTPEEIYDPEKGPDLLADAGKRFYKMCLDRDLDKILRINMEATQKITEIAEKELKEIDYSNDDALESPRNTALMQLCAASFDMRQESDRHKDRCYSILASMKGETIKTDADKAKIAEEYMHDTRNVKALSNLYVIASNKRELCKAALGSTDAVTYHHRYAPAAMQIEFLKAIISDAQKKNQSVVEALPDKLATSLYTFGTSFEDNSAVGKEEYDKIANPRNRDQMKEMAKNLLDGQFSKEHRFSVQTNASGDPVPTVEIDDGLSRHSDHPAEEMDFYSADVTISGNLTEIPQDQKASLDRMSFTALRDHFNIALGKNGQDRLFALNEKNELVSLADKDLASAQGRTELDLLCLNGRLFAVRENENTPVQLKFTHDVQNGWKVSACDCLDHEPQPVGARWYHPILAVLGVPSAKRIIEQRDKAAFRQSILSSVRKVSESRKPLTTFENFSKTIRAANEKAVEECYKTIDSATINTDKAMEAIADIYGQKPVFHPEIAHKGGYTKEQFDTLKEYNFEVAEGKIGEAPKLENGKIRFREVDFIAIAMAAAAVPEIAGKCRENSIKDSRNISNEITVDLNSTMYLNDIAQSYNAEAKLFNTRAGIGEYIENTMTKGRDAAAKAIEQYQNGDKKALVDIIANGIAFASRHFAACQASTSAATRAMNRFMNAYVDMMEADPELDQAVRERCAQLKTEAAAKKEQNLAAKEEFKAAHMDEINTVSAEMQRANASLSDKNNILTTAQHEEVILNQHRFIEEQHPDYYDQIEKLANYNALNILYDIDTRLDVDKTIHGLRRQLRATDAITKGIDAKKKLMTAEFENTSLTADEKESLMKDIIRGELVLHSEKTGARQSEISTDEINKNNEGFAFVFDKKNLPPQRSNDPELYNKDTLTSSKVSSLVSVLLEISSLAKKQDTVSAVTDLIIDPQNGEAALDQFIKDAFPQKDVFKNMKPKYLLEVAQSAPDTIAEVQKNAFAQKKEQQKAAELQNNKNLSKAAEPDNKVLASDQQLAGPK